MPQATQIQQLKMALQNAEAEAIVEGMIAQ